MLRKIITKGLIIILAFIAFSILSINVVDAKYNNLTAEFNDYKTEQSQKYNSLQKRLDETEANLAETQQQVELLETQLEENEIAVEELSISNENLTNQLSTLGVAYYYINQDYEIVLEKKKEADRLNAGQAIAAYADQFVGYPYVYGGNSLTQGCDCSHFIWLVLRDTIGYAGSYSCEESVWLSRGTAVNSLAEAQAGDVIIYPGHYAIYDGNGYIIEARSPSAGITHDIRATYTTILGIRRFV